MRKDLYDDIRALKYKINQSDDNVLEFIAKTNDNGYLVRMSSLEDNCKYTINHLYSDWVEDNISEDRLLDDLKTQRGYFEYECFFGVTGFIHPGRHKEAQEYLADDDIMNYYDGDQKEDIVSARYYLSDRCNNGVIEIKTTARLRKQALSDLKSEIDGQNSDGIGEGFEQQDFITMNKELGGGNTIIAGYIRKYSGFESTNSQ